MSIFFINVLQHHLHAIVRKMIVRPRPHHISLVAVDISQVVSILGHHLNSIGIELVGRLGNKCGHVASFVSHYPLPMIYACNAQDAQIVEYRRPRTIAASLRPRPRVGAILNLLVHIIMARFRCLYQRLDTCALLLHVDDWLIIQP